MLLTRDGVRISLMSKALFSLGRIVATPAAYQAIEQAGDNAAAFLVRHQSGDWGDLSKQDKKENDFSVKNGYRILSSYRLSDNTKIWIITEADRSSTTILLPEEY